MSFRPGGLGRGIDALIPSAPGAAFLRQVPVDAIEPNPRQPRSSFDDDALAELTASVRAVGLLQPVVVRERAAGRYQLVMGERRWRASRAAGLAEIPAIVRSTPDDALLRDAVLENLHRQQLNPLEEAAAYRQLLDDFGATHDELAARLGRSRSQVTNTIRLLNLPLTVQRRVAAGVLSAGHARALLGLDDSEAQERLAARSVAEGLSVRSVEEAVRAGDPGPRQRAPRRPSTPSSELAAVAAGLSEHLDTRVVVDLGRTKGRIVIEFGSLEDLRRILVKMAMTGADPAER